MSIESLCKEFGISITEKEVESLRKTNDIKNWFCENNKVWHTTTDEQLKYKNIIIRIHEDIMFSNRIDARDEIFSIGAKISNGTCSICGQNVCSHTFTEPRYLNSEGYGSYSSTREIVFPQYEPADKNVLEKVAVTIQIGNSDDKLSQGRWSKFIGELIEELVKLECNIHFTGGSSARDEWQNYCIVAEVVLCNTPKLKDMLRDMCNKYNQDSIAYNVSKTEFISYK